MIALRDASRHCSADKAQSARQWLAYCQIECTRPCASVCLRLNRKRVCVRTVSQTPRTRANTATLRGRAEAHRCCGKSLIGSALVGFQYSARSSPPNQMAWGWVCRFAVRSSRRMMADCGSPRTVLEGPYFSSLCAPRIQPSCSLYPGRRD